ncbi:hypothetical protein U0070_001247 [Myodes glareolus]|uniref:Prohibitin n=1 Tax=Myodes glareolus TaxID=447135 RepID=A0AAW0H9Z2_MYOGA
MILLGNGSVVFCGTKFSVGTKHRSYDEPGALDFSGKNTCKSKVDAGHRAVIFDRFRGVQDVVVGEGTHFLIPWVQKPIIFDCRSRPRNVPVITGSKVGQTSDRSLSGRPTLPRAEMPTGYLVRA